MKKKLLFLVLSLVLLLGGISASLIAKTHNQSGVLDTMVEALTRGEQPYDNAENYWFQDGRLCCKDALNRWCTIGYFCN